MACKMYSNTRRQQNYIKRNKHKEAIEKTWTFSTHFSSFRIRSSQYFGGQCYIERYRNMIPKKFALIPYRDQLDSVPYVLQSSIADNGKLRHMIFLLTNLLVEPSQSMSSQKSAAFITEATTETSEAINSKLACKIQVNPIEKNHVVS